MFGKQFGIQVKSTKDVYLLKESLSIFVDFNDGLMGVHPKEIIPDMCKDLRGGVFQRGYYVRTRKTIIVTIDEKRAKK